MNIVIKDSVKDKETAFNIAKEYKNIQNGAVVRHGLGFIIKKVLNTLIVL